jgi:photosystem II stability/assembly factor-like uncharacterized protein
MSDEKDQRQNGFSGDDEEGGPETLQRYVDAKKTGRPDLWITGLDDLNRLNFAGGFSWDQIGPAPLTPTGGSGYYQGFPPVGGQVTDIAIDPSGPADKNIYIATNNGGVWKSTDGGQSWFPTSDLMPSLSMGAVALDSSDPNIVYVGSGGLFGGGTSFVKGAGLYKSVDGGATWFVADGGVFGTSFAGVGVNRIICPAADSLLVGTDRGLFRSKDGGLNFGANTPQFDDGFPIYEGFVSALVMDSAAANIAWLGVKGQGLFKLTLNPDGSVSPAAGNRKLPAASNLLANQLRNVSYGSVVFAQSTRDEKGNPNTNILFVAVQDDSGPKPVFRQLFRSKDGGTSWQPFGNLAQAFLAAPGSTLAEDDQSNFDFTLGVDPQNADRLYAGFKRVWRSDNATQAGTFAVVSQSQVHWDQHELVFSPASHLGAPGTPAPIYVGTDGGVAQSLDGGLNWAQLNDGATTHLFYGIDIGRGPVKNQHTYGGMQDTGTAGHRVGDLPVGNWIGGRDGDGDVVAVDPADPKIVYGFDDEDFIKTTTGGDQWVSSDPLGGVLVEDASNTPTISIKATGHSFLTGDIITIGAKTPIKAVQGNTNANGSWVITVTDPDHFNLNGPSGNGVYVAGTGFAQGRRTGRNLRNPTRFARRVALVPNGNNPATTLYVAENDTLFKSTDGGANFSATPIVTFADNVFALVCPDANTIWAGLGNGNVVFSPDSGSSWQVFPPGGTGQVTGIAVDPADPKRVAAVYAGFSEISAKFRTRHCFLTKDGGSNWDDVSGTDGAAAGNLPDLPLHSVVFDNSTSPSTILVGSDAAVMRSTDNGQTWARLGVGMPRVTCRSLAIDNTDTARPFRLLRVGTYGRSCFELGQDSFLPRIRVEANLGFGAVRQGQSATLRVRVFNTSSSGITFTGFSRTSGDADFDFVTPPDLSPLAVGAFRAFDIRFTAAGTGARKAIFTLQTNDASQPSLAIPATGISFTAGKPRLAVNANLRFGLIERGASRTISFQISNTGLDKLSIAQVVRASGSSEFSLAAPPFPLDLAPGEDHSFDVTFSPNVWGGTSKATFQIFSGDPRNHILGVPAQGQAPYNTALLIAVIALGAVVVAGVGFAVYEAVTHEH